MAHSPSTISLGGEHMDTLIQCMVAAGVVDQRIRTTKSKASRKKGTVPVYKFCWNEGLVVTAKEASMIADALARHDVLGPEFLKKHFPKVKPGSVEMDIFNQLLGLWIAYNRVAAANNGYAIT